MTTWKDGGDCGRVYREIVNEDECHVIAKVRIKQYAFHRPAFTPTIPWPEGKANFALILQAPRMLEALEKISRLVQLNMSWGDLNEIEHLADTAIAAVKGENDETG